MKAKIHIRIYKDKPLWDTAASGQVIVDLSNKEPSALTETKNLLLKLLKEIEENEENKTPKEDNIPERKGCEKEEPTVKVEDEG